MTVLVTGVRGTVGRGVADRLHRAGIAVRGASARADDVTGAPYPVAPVDLRAPVGLADALDGVEAVFLYAAHDAVGEVARTLVRAEVRHVVVLSSASVEMPGAAALAAHHQAVEDAVANAGLPWTFLRPGAFANNTLAWAPGIRAGRVALPYPDAFVEPIHEADVVDAAAALLSSPHRENRAYFLTGGESLTQREQVQAIGDAIDREVAVDELTPEQWSDQVEAFMPANVIEALLAMWQAAVGRPGRVDGTVGDVTGAEPRTFRQWVSEHVDDFR